MPKTTRTDADRKQTIRDLTVDWERRYTPDSMIPTLCLAALEYAQYVIAHLAKTTTDSHRRAIRTHIDSLLHTISIASTAPNEPRKEIDAALDALSRFCQESNTCPALENLDASEFMDEEEFKRLQKAFETDDQSYY